MSGVCSSISTHVVRRYLSEEEELRNKIWAADMSTAWMKNQRDMYNLILKQFESIEPLKKG